MVGDDHEDLGEEQDVADHDGNSIENRLTDDSDTDFEIKIKRLLHSGQIEDVTQNTRRSERMKKPSSRWNEEAGFISQPPRSAKKKGTSTSPPEGTSSNHLLINDWTDIQLHNYAKACGITFDSIHLRDKCFAHIRMLESSRSTPVGDVAGTSKTIPASGSF